jgi:AcrR family transcriptional regulator
MARRRGDTRRDILNAAEQLLQLRGYNGFSYHNISAALGIRNAAVHYHFPSKADLGAAVMRRFRENFAWWRDQLDARSACGAERIEAFLELDARYATERKVCPLGVVGVEFSGLPPEMCREADHLLDDVAEFLQAALELGRDDGSLRFTGEPRALALQILAATQGALQLSRLRGSRGYAGVARGLREQLGMVARAPGARAAGQPAPVL